MKDKAPYELNSIIKKYDIKRMKMISSVVQYSDEDFEKENNKFKRQIEKYMTKVVGHVIGKDYKVKIK